MSDDPRTRTTGDERGVDFGRRAVVAPKLNRNAASVAEFFSGWTHVRPFEPLMGHRFKRIVMCWLPDDENGWMWVREVLKCRLEPGAELEWLT